MSKNIAKDLSCQQYEDLLPGLKANVEPVEGPVMVVKTKEDLAKTMVKYKDLKNRFDNAAMAKRSGAQANAYDTANEARVALEKQEAARTAMALADYEKSVIKKANEKYLALPREDLPAPAKDRQITEDLIKLVLESMLKYGIDTVRFRSEMKKIGLKPEIDYLVSQIKADEELIDEIQKERARRDEEALRDMLGDTYPPLDNVVELKEDKDRSLSDELLLSMESADYVANPDILLMPEIKNGKIVNYTINGYDVDFNGDYITVNQKRIKLTPGLINLLTKPDSDDYTMEDYRTFGDLLEVAKYDVPRDETPNLTGEQATLVLKDAQEDIGKLAKKSLRGRLLVSNGDRWNLGGKTSLITPNGLLADRFQLTPPMVDLFTKPDAIDGASYRDLITYGRALNAHNYKVSPRELGEANGEENKRLRMLADALIEGALDTKLPQMDRTLSAQALIGVFPGTIAKSLAGDRYDKILEISNKVAKKKDGKGMLMQPKMVNRGPRTKFERLHLGGGDARGRGAKVIMNAVPEGKVAGNKRNPYKIYKCQDGQLRFGGLVIDPVALGEHRLKATNEFSGRGVINSKIPDKTFFELMSKRYNPRTMYTKKSIDLFRNLVEKSGLPPIERSAKTDLIRPELKPMDPPKQGGRILLVDQIEDVIKRLEVLTGLIEAGNRSKHLVNELTVVSDFLLENKVLKKKGHKAIFDNYIKPYLGSFK